MKTNLDQPDLLPTTAKTLGEVYASLIQRHIERKATAKVSDCEPSTLTPAKDTKTEANS